MSKKFDAEVAQSIARGLREGLHGRRFRHWKGGEYAICGVDVDEPTGRVRISYVSVTPGPKHGWVWSRTLENFIEDVHGSPRFQLLPGNGAT